MTFFNRPHEHNRRKIAMKDDDTLNRMSQEAFELIKIIELEKSGVRDGDGFWHGSDALGNAVQEIVASLSDYRQAQTKWREAAKELGNEVAF